MMKIANVIAALLAVCAMVQAAAPPARNTASSQANEHAGSAKKNDQHADGERGQYAEGSKRVHFDRFMVIIMENEEIESVLSDKNFQEFAGRGRLLNNSHGVTHVSEPNYVSMIAGSYFDQHDDNEHRLRDAHSLVDLMEHKGISWTSYNQKYIALRESDPAFKTYGTSCNRAAQLNPDNGKNAATNKACDYQRKHNPFMNFANIYTSRERCDKIKGASQKFGDADDVLLHDIRSGNLADYVFYVPDQCNDGHNSDTAFSGQWLADNFFARGKYLDLIDQLDSTTLVLLTYDEGEPSDTSVITAENYQGTGKPGNRIYSVLFELGKTKRNVIRPGETDGNLYSHYSMLRMVENNWGLGNLGRCDAPSAAYSTAPCDPYQLGEPQKIQSEDELPPADANAGNNLNGRPLELVYPVPGHYYGLDMCFNTCSACGC